MWSWDSQHNLAGRVFHTPALDGAEVCSRI